MAYTITGGGAVKVDLGATGIAEVLQNILIILMTPVYSVPLDREFGIDWSLLDNPIPMAQAKLTAQIFSAIREYEPRAEVIEIDFIQSTEDMLDGRIIPRVLAEVNI